MLNKYLLEFYILDEIFSNLSDGISLLNENEETVFVNVTFLKLTKYSFIEVIGENINILSFIKEKNLKKYKEIKRSLEDKSFWEGELWIENKEKHFFPIICKFIKTKELEETYIIEIFTDVTEIRKHKEYFNYLKYFDEFLDLPNKIFLREKIENKLKLKEKFSVILITVNNLKKVNDTYGRKIGDNFLILVSKKLRKLIEKLNLSLFYLEGNQFVIICERTKKDEINEVVKKAYEEFMEEPMIIENFEIPIDASSGCYIPMEDDDYYSIIHKLYISNEVAKTKSKKIVFYQKRFKEEITTKYKIEELIKRAIKNNKFVLYYQPRVNLKTLKIDSVEALIRMVSDKGLLISPGVFIPVAEESGLINEIGNWVFNQIIEDARYINIKSEEELKFSFNVSANHFLELDFLDRLSNIFKFSQDFNSKFEVEITEWALMKDVENSIEKMYKLKELGFDIIIDDFGTGYSSLGYLKEFPVDVLKIDKIFTDGIPNDKKTVNIVKSIIYLAKQLNLKITAEGVENSKQYNWYKSNGCDEIQGYYFSKPVSKDKIVRLIKVFNQPAEKTKYLKWEEDFETGVTAFDAHHMIIFNILNKIYEEIHDKDLIEKTCLINYFDMLERYIQMHFKEEERYLREKKIPDLKNHINEHRKFQNEIFLIKNKFQKGTEKLEYDLFNVLRSWWKNHILKYDKKYYLQTNN